MIKGEDRKSDHVTNTVYILTSYVLYETCDAEVSKLIILHEEGEDGKSDLDTHTMYSFNPSLYSMHPVYVQVSKLIILHKEGEDRKSDLVTHKFSFLTLKCTL